MASVLFDLAGGPCFRPILRTFASLIVANASHPGIAVAWPHRVSAPWIGVAFVVTLWWSTLFLKRRLLARTRWRDRTSQARRTAAKPPAPSKRENLGPTGDSCWAGA